MASPLSCLLRGVSTSVIEDASFAVLPISVLSPVAIIVPSQVPSVMIVDLSNLLVGYVALPLSYKFLLTGIDSPVIVDSSTFKLVHSLRIISAGISSPALRATISPSTRNLRCISTISPSRYTLTNVESPLVISKSNFLLADQVLQNPIPTTIAIATIMPIGSVNSPLMHPRIRDTAAATSNIIIKGSLNPSKSITYQGSLLGGVSTLRPSRSNLAAASLCVNPFIVIKN